MIFTGRLPEGAAGLASREDRSARVKQALGELFAGEPRMDAVVRPGRGTAALVSSTDAVLRQLGSVLRADFHVVEPNASTPDARKAALENVGFVHRRAGAVDYYFVANVSAHTQHLRVAFAAGHRAPERWDPETGAVLAPLVYDYTAAEGRRSTEVELRLEPYESCFVVFGQAKDAPLVTRARWPGRLEIAKRGGAVELSGLLPADEAPAVRSASGGTRTVPVEGLPAPFEIPGPWALRLGETAPLTLPRLVSWDQLDEGRAYSGWGSYETEFELGATPGDVEWLIDLGAVHETAEASLNGTGLGAAWKGLRRLACGPALRPGRNHLKVDVANLWIHHVAASPAPDWRASRRPRDSLGPLRRSQTRGDPARRPAGPGPPRSATPRPPVALTQQAAGLKRLNRPKPAIQDRARHRTPSEPQPGAENRDEEERCRCGKGNPAEGSVDRERDTTRRRVAWPSEQFRHPRERRNTTERRRGRGDQDQQRTHRIECPRSDIEHTAREIRN